MAGAAGSVQGRPAVAAACAVLLEAAGEGAAEHFLDAVAAAAQAEVDRGRNWGCSGCLATWVRWGREL